MQEIHMFKKFLQIEMERQKAMQELSEILGIDISFSKDEMIKNAQENFSRAISQKISDDFKKALRR
jgi:DNA-binding ferritin-like protein (Dps family)